MSRWGHKIYKQNNTTDLKAFIEPTVEGMRKKGTKREKISCSEILQIAYRVLVGKEYQSTVAKAYRISAA